MNSMFFFWNKAENIATSSSTSFMVYMKNEFHMKKSYNQYFSKQVEWKLLTALKVTIK